MKLSIVFQIPGKMFAHVGHYTVTLIILEYEDSYKDLDPLSQKLSGAISFVSPIISYSFLSYLTTSYNILRCQPLINYIAVSVDLICFRISFIFLCICSF